MTTGQVVSKPQLREMVKLKDGTSKMRLNFHEGQSRVWDSKARFVCFLAGTQSGKTSFAPHWLEREIRSQGPGDYLAVTATFPLLNLKMLPEFRYVFESLMHYGEYNTSSRVFEFYRKKKKPSDRILFTDEEYEKAGVQVTRVIFGSATNPESIESATAKAAWLDEAGQKQFKRDSWEAILRRLSLNKGRVLITTTLYTLGWLKNELYDPWEKGNPDIDIIQVDSIINPVFPMEEYRRAKATLPDWKFKLFYQGRFSTPAGLIYDSFDPAAEVMDPFPISKDWLIYIGHDFGSNNTAALFKAMDPATGHFYTFAEYVEGGRSTAEHVRAWQDMTEGYKVVSRVGGAHHEDGWRGDFTQAGWRIVEPNLSNVEAGIQRVYSVHKTGKNHVFRNCLRYLDEKQTYSRELDDNYKPTDKIDSKEKYHLMDCERYLHSNLTPVEVDVNETQQVWVY